MSLGFIIGIILVVLGISAITGWSIFPLIIGVLLIYIGVRMMTNHRKENFSETWMGSHAATTVREDRVNEVFVFSSVNKVFQSTAWRGGKIVMVFAGGQIDLRNVKPVSDTFSLEMVAVMSDVKILVPKNWKVNSEGSAVMGGYNNMTEPTDIAVTLNLKGSVVIGQIEIVN